MEQDDLALGIDFGTSGVRAVLMNREREVVAQQSTTLASLGQNHRDPQLWWQALEQTLDALAQAETASWSRLACVAIDGTSGTMLALDDQNQPLGDALMYNDPVQDAQILEEIAREAPQESAAHGATSGLAKAMYLQQLAGCQRLLHQADWAMGKLLDDYRFSDENNALKTGYDPICRCWPEWIQQTRANLDLLPQVVAPGELVGPLSSTWRQRFGLHREVWMVAGSTDGCAAFLATGAQDVGDGVTSLGSTLVVKLLSDQPIFAPQYGIYSHRLGNRWLPGGASNTGGAVLAQFFSSEELRAISDKIDPTQPTGLDFYPLSKPGERFPVNDPNFSPRLTPRPPEDERFLQGMLEGMSAIEAQAYARLAELGGPKLESVRTVGGGAHNPVWTQLRKQRLGVPMWQPKAEDAAAGVARLAWQGLESR